jgi:hypothetical protein
MAHPLSQASEIVRKSFVRKNILPVVLLTIFPLSLVAQQTLGNDAIVKLSS